jgi:hypothetical protein
MNAKDLVAPVELRLDDPLRDYRQRSDGVAFVGPDVPIEVLFASGRPFGHLPWRADAPTPWADQWLESSFPYWARSILEQWYQGEFDTLATVVFSRGEDACQRLYYYIAELKRRGKLAGPSPLIFDVAYVPSESSLGHTQAAVQDLMQALDVSADSLNDGIERANRLRRRFAELERGRHSNGPLYERLSRAALWSDPTRWLDDVELPAADSGAPRILLAGSMPPDDRIHQAVESAGASVIAEAHMLAAVRLGAELKLDVEPVERTLARHLRFASIAPRAFFNRSDWIVERARAVRAGAVVIWLTREDEALTWTAPSEQRALQAAGFPTLMLPAGHWQADDGAVERIAEFCTECTRASA